MQIYLIDDDAAVRSVLRLLIEDGSLGTIVGCSDNAMDALEDLREIHPDIVVVDLLMPGMDGIEFVQQAKGRWPELRFVMLSQVTSKDMVAEAYAAGVDFFISKPVNSVEVASVLTKVSQLLAMDRTMRQVRSLVQVTAPASPAPSPSKAPKKNLSSAQQTALHNVLHRLGLSGDPAYGDILQIVGYLTSQGREEQATVQQLAQSHGAAHPPGGQRRHGQPRQPRHRGLRQRHLHRVRRDPLQLRAGPQGDGLHSRQKQHPRKNLRQALSLCPRCPLYRPFGLIASIFMVKPHKTVWFLSCVFHKIKILHHFLDFFFVIFCFFLMPARRLETNTKTEG